MLRRATQRVQELQAIVERIPRYQYEVNPLVASLAMLFGPVGGLVCSKAIASLIVIRVRRLVWVANVFYGGVICWNVIVVVALLVRRH